MRFPTRLGAGVAAAAALAALALPACTKKKPAASPSASKSATKPSPSPSKTPDAQANFIAQGVAAIDSENRPSANAAANDAEKKAIDLIDSYYNIAFIQPSRWAGGSHPDLATLFSDDAKPSVAANLQVLALGSVAPQLTRVDPNLQNASLAKVLIEQNGSASLVAISTLFDGTGRRTAPGAPVVHIVHNAQFLIDVVGNKIVGYDMTNAIDSVAKSASYSPSGSAGISGMGGA